MLRRVAILITVVACSLCAGRAETSIQGEPQVDAATMARFVARHNPGFDPCIAETFIEIGRRYGIRGDIALCQAILETGWFKYAGGTAVKPSQHNYCGLGVTRNGLKGASFESIEQGVTAMIQHLYAYCSTDRLPDDATLVDPRFNLVSRGSAKTWEALSNRWAANPDYGTLILRIYKSLVDSSPRQVPGNPAADMTGPAHSENATEMSHNDIFH